MARRTLDLVDPRIAKALSHPMRAQILMILNDRVASPNEIAEAIDERLPNVSYHVRALLDLETIELVDTAQRRGAIEHYYRAIVRPYFTDRDWKRLPRSARQAISDSILQILWDDVSASIQAGLFESRTDRHLAHSRMVLDEEGWAAMVELLNGALAEAERIEASSKARLKKLDDGEGIPTTLALLQFESPNAAG
ncbi:MAG TPA: helix-turn-helix domain-containing protein [Thermoleophilaceae bacterium]|jgi:DNA-binding transcriptional ArsR family regulator|nr:helix-turn-helix domain-containing protein [Thermoleophilaceae bacterium]